jgi:peroxiredoxin
MTDDRTIESTPEPADSDPVAERPAAPPSTTSSGTGRTVLLGVMAVAVIAMLGVGLWQLGRLSTRIDGLETAIESMDVGNLEDDIAQNAAGVSDLTVGLDELTTAVTELEASIEESSSRSPITLQETTSALPRFQAGVQDQAVGMTMPTLTGPDFYSGEVVSTDFDGKAAIVMMFAHWCPFCQQELPILSELWATRRDEFPNVELISVSTGQDESRGNPEGPYLEELQLPFPVIVDSGNALAAEAGLSAFPYWIFVGPDGSVLGRATGLIEEEQIGQLFADLDRFAAEN